MEEIMRHEFNALKDIGISGFPEEWLTEDVARKIAMDSAPLITTQNNGVPAWMTMYTHPDVIKILTAKRASEDIFSPIRTGAYGTMTAKFPIIEHTGDVMPYADYGTEGVSNYNVNWPEREAYYFQNMSEWGDMQMAVMGMGKINAAAEIQAAAALAIKIAHNKFWFYGVSGLKNYGILNDPNLNPSIAPTVGANSATTWGAKATTEIYNDVLALFSRLNVQAGANLKDGWKMSDNLLLCMSNLVSPHLHKATNFNVSVIDMIKKSFPNMEIVTAPEFSTQSGELLYLIAPKVMGQKTGFLAYTELMKAHGVVRASSSYKEKNSASSFGAVIRQPFAIASMLGV
jgi:hypothetical protein